MKKSILVFISITALFVLIMSCVLIARSFPGGKSSVYSDSNQGKVDINTATVEELCMLPGIGQVLAERIIQYRQANGHFSSPEDLLKVEGLGEKKLESIQMYITIGG